MWDKCLAKLKKELTISDFTMWVNPLQFRQHKTHITLIAPNATAMDYINKNLKKTIISTIKELSEKTTISFEIMPRSGGRSIITTNLSKEFSFDNLVEGNANMFALSAGKKIAENIKKPEYNPFIIYGASGLGKTHLIQAIGNLSLKLNPSLRVVYISLMDFVRNITTGLRHKTIEEVKEYYQRAQVLLIDDIHMIAGKEKTQEEFFHIFNFLFNNKKQIIMTCDQIPNNIEGLEQRLKTRLTSGISIEIKPPETEMRQAIIQQKTENIYNIRLTEEAIFYISSNIKSNVRELEGAIKTIKAFVSFSNIDSNIVDKAIAQEALKNIINERRVEADIFDIQKQTAKQYGITQTDLISKSRKQNIAHARHTAIYLSKQLTSLSLKEIGKNFGNRDHSTIISSCAKFEELITTKEDLKQQYEIIILKLSTN